MTDLISRALDLATKAHAGQKRKHYDMPFIVHPIRVAGYVAAHEIGKEESHIAIALLHDVVEDTERSYQDIFDLFGMYVAFGVKQLTNLYTKKNCPDWNRKKRKQREHERLSLCDHPIKVIKLCDRLDNIYDFVLHDSIPDYYREETLDLLDCIGDADKILSDFILAKL